MYRKLPMQSSQGDKVAKQTMVFNVDGIRLQKEDIPCYLGITLLKGTLKQINNVFLFLKFSLKAWKLFLHSIV